MLFKVSEIVDNKLSEKISGTNKWKDKLIAMESDNFKSPIYSFVCISLLIYIWAYQILLSINKGFGYQYSLILVLITTYEFFNWFKKDCSFDTAKNTNKLIKTVIMPLLIYIVIMIAIDPRSGIVIYYPDSIFGEFLLFDYNLITKSFDANSYLYINIMCFFLIGILITYSNYYHKYSYLNCLYTMLNSAKKITGKTFLHTYLFMLLFNLICILSSKYLILFVLRKGYKSAIESNLIYLMFTSISCVSIILYQATCYLIIYKLAKKSNK